MKKFLMMLFISAIFLMCHDMYGQSFNAHFTYPTAGMQSVPRTPVIRLVTDGVLVSSSATLNYPYYEENTPIANTRKATFLLLPSSIWNNPALPAQVKDAHAMPGKCVIIDSHTIDFSVEPRTLDYGTEYTVVIQDMQIIDPLLLTPVSVNVPSLVFSTVLPPHEIVGSSFDRRPGFVLCTDTVSVTFNRPLSSATTSLGNIINIYEAGNTSPIAINTWLSTDSRTVYAKPVSSFQPGTEHYMEVNTYYLTGDPSNIWKNPFVVQSKSLVKIKVAGFAGKNVSLPTIVASPGIGTFAAEINQSLNVAVPNIVGSVYFKRWNCPDYPQLHGSTSSSVQLLFNCSNLRDISLVAEYDAIPKDTIQLILPVGTSPACKFVVTGYADDLGGNKYTLLNKTGERVHVAAIPPSGYKFGQWTSNDTHFNNQTSPLISIEARNSQYWGASIRKITLEPGISPFNPVAECSEYKFCVKVYEYEEGDYNLATIIAMNAPFSAAESPNLPSSPCLVFQTPTNYNLTAGIMAQDGCWEITHWWSTDGQHGGDYSGINTIQTMNANFALPASNSCDVTVHVYIRKKSFLLHHILEMKEGGIVPWSHIVAINNSPEETFLNTVVSNGGRRVEYDKKYKCSTTVLLTPYAKSNTGYKVGKWVCSDADGTYDCAPIVDNQQQILKVTMNQNRVVKHAFESDFMLTHIMFMDPDVPGSFKEYSVVPGGKDPYRNGYNYDIDLGLLYAAPPAIHVNTTVVRLRFSHKVDETTLPGNFIVKDDLPRKDGKSKTTYNYRINDNGVLLEGRTVASMQCVDDLEKLMPHMQAILIKANSGIKDELGTSLANPDNFVGSTILPGLEVELEKFVMEKPTDASGEDEVLVDVHLGIGTNDVYSSLQEDIKYRFPNESGGYEEMEKNDEYTIQNLPLYYVRRLKQRDVFDIGWHGVDVNNGRTIEKFKEIIGKTKELLQQTKPNVWTTAAYLATAAADYFSTSILINDRTIDRSGSRGTDKTLWGCSKLYSKEKKNLGDAMQFQFHILLR